MAGFNGRIKGVMPASLGFGSTMQTFVSGFHRDHGLGYPMNIRLGDMCEVSKTDMVRDLVTGEQVPAREFADYNAAEGDPFFALADGFLTVDGERVFGDTNQEVVAVLFTPATEANGWERGEEWWSIPVEAIRQVLPGEKELAWIEECRHAQAASDIGGMSR